MQDTFIKVLKDPYQIKRFSSWGYRVIRNRCIDLAKKKSPQLLDSIEVADDPHGEGVHVSTHINEKHRDIIHKKWTFFDSIKRLPIRHQTALIKRFWKRLRNEQIAEQMKVPYNTIETWINRGKKKLEKIRSENETGWIQTNGPYGGTITALHASSKEILFAGTLGGGIFCSMDGGDTWVHASKGLGDLPPTSKGLRRGFGHMPPAIRSFTQKKNTLYAATDRGLFYSTNRDVSWQQLTDGAIWGVAIIGDTIYIGQFPQASVFFSNDNGKSWGQIDSGLTDRGTPILFASGTTLFAQMSRHVFRLKAGENSWTKLTIKDSSKKNTVGSDITRFTVSGKMAYAITADGGLFRSTDMGESWQSIKPQAMQGCEGKLAALENTVFYIDSDSADGQVFRSTDAGNTWTTFNTNLTNQSILSIATLSDKTLCVGTDNGVFCSTNSGESWAQVTPGITDTDSEDLVFFKNALYTVTGDGIVKSKDGGYSWGLANNGLIANDGTKLAVSDGILIWTGAKLAVSDGKLYAATCQSNTSKWNPGTSGIYCWAEDENSWLPIHMNMPTFNDRIDVIDQLAISGETFYVIAHNRLYRWKVGEELWTDLGLRVWHGRGFAVSDGTVCVQRDDGEILHSLDEGDTWTEVSRLPKSNVVVQPKEDTPLYRFDPQTDSPIFKLDLDLIGQTVCAASRYGIFLLINGAWKPISNGLPRGYVKIQLINGTTLYATSSHGIFRWTRESDSWKLVARIQHPVRSLAFDGTTFYALTDSEGLFWFSLDE